ncbi:hypothetical protein NTE_01207 [Candidatus Nitrososphaera evergladensis SR1]|uniref:Uncharacterized protein n=1 Tax=Candidatus Nitrososphaera evergladensis SR1 TaxID=1459636 RepID=A0A075MVI6_9ARCH|nr:hypothetical protein [Candidatus Nitrososphaera evergladensis]AIF83279.1 hypothetical protein NTE_01207 [Candidatus Nitrososphaera evergladensis SR1]
MAEQFIEVGDILRELTRLLGKNLSRDLPDTPIQQSINTIFQLHNAHRYQERNYHIAILQFLVRNLLDIEKHDQKLLKKYRRIIRDSLDVNKYYGARFEVATASTLIRNKCNFERVIETTTPTPDFVIHEVSDVFLECGSTHLSNPRPKDFEYKIISEAKEKGRKTYCNHKTVLLLDISNILHHAIRFNMPIHARLEAITEKAVGSTKFGSLLLFDYIIDSKTHQYSHSYLRKDNSDIDSNLQLLLDRIFPSGHVRIESFYQPSFG